MHCKSHTTLPPETDLRGCGSITLQPSPREPSGFGMAVPGEEAGAYNLLGLFQTRQNQAIGNCPALSPGEWPGWNLQAFFIANPYGKYWPLLAQCTEPLALFLCNALGFLIRAIPLAVSLEGDSLLVR